MVSSCKLKQFSLIGATAPDDTETNCTALMFYKEQIPYPLIADFHFVVVRDIEPYLKVIFSLHAIVHA